ncbi:MAG: DUF4062 domain-containing protein [Nitrosomonadales bacterium]|nr:DUF4062 domain-containing protein [Nitrosomonadales bacterium]
MTFEATACNVMIASPSDVQIERNIVREVIHEWNAVNAFTRHIVLLPVGWETHSSPLMGDHPQSIINWQVLKNSDLLIAVFWTRLGTPTQNSASGTVEEIEEHVSAGKPAMIYFSSAPVAMDSVDQDQYAALTKFRNDCKARGLFYSYESTSEFHDKIRRHLAITLNSNPYLTALFPTAIGIIAAPAGASKVTGAPNLSREAKELLLEAVAGGGDILVIAWMGGSTVQANGRNFVEPNDPRSRAIWEGAVDELDRNGLVQSVGHKGEIFRVTREGYDAADLLRP